MKLREEETLLTTPTVCMTRGRKVDISDPLNSDGVVINIEIESGYTYKKDESIYSIDAVKSDRTGEKITKSNKD